MLALSNSYAFGVPFNKWYPQTTLLLWNASQIWSFDPYFLNSIIRYWHTEIEQGIDQIWRSSCNMHHHTNIHCYRCFTGFFVSRIMRWVRSTALNTVEAEQLTKCQNWLVDVVSIFTGTTQQMPNEKQDFWRNTLILQTRIHKWAIEQMVLAKQILTKHSHSVQQNFRFSLFTWHANVFVKQCSDFCVECQISLFPVSVKV